GVDVREPVTQFLGVTVLSNLVSNVPAVMLLLPWAKGPMAGPVLALASTLAGDMGYRITWKEHARVGVPITLLTLGVAGAWLWARAMMMG
ncbi:MAG: anion transporter, partial [Verrucomicrobiae bacterium]|nr:anion transporter [Verrucomicrobiae bacterium]